MRAAYFFAIAALFAAIVFSTSRWTTVLLPRLAGCSAPFLIFGLFWLGTHKLGWSSLLLPRPRTGRRRVTALLFASVVVLFLDVAVTLGISAMRSSLFSGDCRGKPIFVHSLGPSHAVFTARIIYVGRSLEARTRNTGLFRSGHSAAVLDPRVGDWAVGVVQERFWGLPSWAPRLVLLTDYIYWKGETYFIDGGRANGLLTQFLPIVGAGVNCSRTRPASDAVVELRALREAPSASGRRLIGYVRQPEEFVGGLVPPIPPKPAVGARISFGRVNRRKDCYRRQVRHIPSR